MPVLRAIDMQQRDEGLAGQFMHRFPTSMIEGNSAGGLPEFQYYPKARARFLQASMRLKQQPASKAHILALTKTVFDAVSNLSAEIEKLKRTR